MANLDNALKDNEDYPTVNTHTDNINIANNNANIDNYHQRDNTIEPISPTYFGDIKWILI